MSNQQPPATVHRKADDEAHTIAQNRNRNTPVPKFKTISYLISRKILSVGREFNFSHQKKKNVARFDTGILGSSPDMDRQFRFKP
jgi:hypothetical protein